MRSWNIGRTSVHPHDLEGWDKDPRGLLWMWEEPRPDCEYFIGVDPTVGLTGWSRHARTRDDAKTDNAVIEVFKSARKGDEQVAEYAAPIDALDIARVINCLGKLYAGRAEDGEALVIVEVTGPGSVTIPELRNTWNYTNLWQQVDLDKITNRRTIQWGWKATRESNRALFMKALRHINRDKVLIQSPWLVEEFADCTSDWVKAELRAKWGRHDDRVRATFLALWAAHDWTREIDEEPATTSEEKNQPDYQYTDCTVEDMNKGWDESMERLLP